MPVLGNAGLAVSSPPIVPATALRTARTVYVNSATGSDVTGDGTLLLPWATLGRAWTERQRYLELQAKFTVQLLGVGPYELPPMLGSVCADAGFFVVLGDPAVEVVTASGTATGDFAGNVIPTTALVPLAHKNQFLKFTSGVELGAVYQLTENAANSVTVANKAMRTSAGLPIVNGDAFNVVMPGTRIRITGGYPNGPRLENLEGVSGDNRNATSNPRHVFYGVEFFTADLSPLQLQNAAVAFSFVSLAATTQVFSRGSQVVCGLLKASVVGVIGDSNLVWGAGMVSAYFMQFIQSRFIGVMSWGSFGLTLSGGLNSFVWAGGVAGGPATLHTVFLESAGTGSDMRIEATLSLTSPQGAAVIAGGSWRFVVTSGSCWLVQNGATLIATSIATMTGGTSDAAGYGVDVRGGGHALYRNVTPALTGGTAAADLRTTSVTAANAALNANGTSVATAADLLLGEQLARAA